MQIVSQFAECMQRHSFHTALVIDLIAWMCDKYNELVVRQCQQRIRKVYLQTYRHGRVVASATLDRLNVLHVVMYFTV
jgi:hypothetical protein